MNLIFFLDFNLQHYTCWNWSFVFYFFVFFYEFIIISGPGHNLFKLTRFFLLLFLIDFFSILSINIKLVKNNYVIFLKKNMGLSWSHNSCCGFDKLTQVDSVYFLSFFNWIIIFQFHPPTTQSSSFLFMVFFNFII